MKVFLLIVFSLLTISAFAQEGANSQGFIPEVKWLGDVRVRSELDGRDFDNSNPPNAYTLLRTRIGVEALPADRVRVFVQAQDARVFGQEKDATGFSTLADSKNLDLHQAYVEVKDFLADGLMFRLGRMELSYGNERLIGAVGWHNVGRAFDGGLLRYSAGSALFDLFATNTGEVQAYAPVATPAAAQYTRDIGQNFYGFYVNGTLSKDHRLDGYCLFQWNKSVAGGGEDSLKRVTIGSYAKGRFDSFDYMAECAYQGGKTGTADVSAFMITASLGISIQESPFTSAALGYEYLSGTAQGGTGFKAFDPVFHTGHKFYGTMDYFINIPTNTGNRGLTDAFLRSALKLSDRLTAQMWVHHFTLAQDAGGERGLGQEFDAVAQFKYNPAVAFDLGCSAFAPGPVMRQRFGSSGTSYWGYCSTTVSF